MPYGVHTSLCRTKILGDPPKSPLKRGTLTPVPPFLRGARQGGLIVERLNEGYEGY